MAKINQIVHDHWSRNIRGLLVAPVVLIGDVGNVPGPIRLDRQDRMSFADGAMISPGTATGDATNRNVGSLTQSLDRRDDSVHRSARLRVRLSDRER